MNYFSKIRIGTWIVIILTLVNIATLGTILYKGTCERHEEDSMGENKPPQSHDKNIHWKQLNLSPEQEAKFREMGKLYFDSVKVIYKLRNSLAKEIASELKKVNPNKEELNRLAAEMGNNYTRSKLLTIDHLINLKGQCRPDQIHGLDSMYYKLIIGFERPPRKRQGPKPQDSLTLQTDSSRH